MENKDKEDKIDDDFYSRSIFTFGLETMKKLSQLKILIMGLRGLGVETAKNIILSGPEQVDIYDSYLVRINDLGSNFYLSESDVLKKRRDEASIEKLSKLNPNVKVSALKDEKYYDSNFFLTQIVKYNVVVITELYPMPLVTQIDKICRSNNIKFLYGVCFGLVGYIFTDFGPKHIIYDEKGGDIKSYIIESITKDKNGLVTIDNIQNTVKLNLGEDDFVRFKNVGGMTELNDEKKEFQIHINDYHSFTIGDTSKFGEYTKGGVVYHVKKPIEKQYIEFAQRALYISDPAHPLINIKEGRNELLYMTFICIHDFYYANNYCLPQLNNMELAKMIMENVRKFYEAAKQRNIYCFKDIQEFDEKVVLNVIRWASANIQPICSFFGGILSQEIIKATGKYVPIDQWLIFDFFELVENIKDDADRTLKNCRYDDQIAIFGNEIQGKIQNSNIFQVGAGATGCEFLKNFAMMGFCTSENSQFIVADNDNIEISNLNRQFLFQKDNVGQPKSIVAVKTVQEMNPSFKAKGMVAKVCKETEEVFNEEFWEKQHFIIFAVDSAEARKYLDSKVILYQKNAIDTGTLGLRAISQIIIPNRTKTYSDKAPTEEKKTIPVCTLRSFPSLIDHCIEFERDTFYGFFGNIINEVKGFFMDYNRFKQNLKREKSPKFQLNKLNLLKTYIDIVITKDINKMCKFAIKRYTENFDHNIQDLLITYPPDYKTKDGLDFWTGSKRMPHPIHFDPNIDLCLNYVIKFVQILSHSLGIQLTKEQLYPENIKKICSSIKVPEFVIITNDKEVNTKKKIDINKIELEQKEAQEKINELIKELDQIKREDFDAKLINPEEFEKDHDENGHIDFIHFASNLRARNYNIDECDRNKTKQIAGNIIPTILTTTATIAAHASLQLYTFLQTNNIEYFRDCIIELSINNYCFPNPDKPVKMEDKEVDNTPRKFIPEGWNSWDRLEVKETKTCKELCEYLKQKYNVEIENLSIDNRTIYDIYLPSFKKNGDLKIEDIYEKNFGKKIDDKKRYLLIRVLGIISETKIKDKTYNNIPISMPHIKYILKKQS